ncbi:MAG TPA: sigma-70 family RNA polymerase sigma factor [Anaerolineae bacterium]|jgi:RNA polymerase sigma-70 factor (ECF subfamily)|nr:sigma-70 family RNA polymerase sigma factor [Anaerolineae bacterium]
MISDNVLAKQAKSGDIKAFEELLGRYRAPICFIIMRTIGQLQEAEDNIQEVYLSAYKNLEQFNPDKASFKTWLFNIAKNRCIDSLRKSKNNPVLMDEQAYVASSDFKNPETALEILELKDALKSGLLNLSEEQRLCLILKSVEGLSHKEIAEIMGLPVGTVKSRIFAARKSLLKAVSHFMEGDISCDVIK